MQRRPPRNDFWLFMTILFAIIFGTIGFLTCTAPRTSSPTATPTPSGPRVLFSLVNQHSRLSFEETMPFDAHGTLRIEYGCIHDIKPGLDVQFTLLRLVPDTETNPYPMPWMVRVDCKNHPTIEGSVTLSQGTYAPTVATSGDVGWSMTITQE